MKLRICSLWGPSLCFFSEQITLAAELGFDLVTVGDWPSGWHEMVVSLTLASQLAPHAQIAPLVTSPFMRPLVPANALCSLDELSGGRMALGLATGGSTVLATGYMPATQAQVRSEFAAYRAAFAGENFEFGGRPVKALQFAQKVPIYYSAFGPKALALAGELADGVILFAGHEHLDTTRDKIAAVRESATRAGRNADLIDIWVTSYISIRPTKAQAFDDLKALIAVNAMALRTPETLAMVPENVRPLVIEFQRRYDASEHVVVGGRNVALLDEFGLADFLQDFDTIAGPEAIATDAMRRLEAMGVSTLIAALPGMPIRSVQSAASPPRARRFRTRQGCGGTRAKRQTGQTGLSGRRCRACWPKQKR